MRISLMGLPGSGKTTLASMLGGIFNTMHISSGDLARAHGFANSHAERTGQLDPDETKIRNLVIKAIGDSNAYILDGFPRTIEQIDTIQLPLDTTLWLKLGDYQIGINRLLARHRPDDTIDIIETRIATYFRCTDPLINYYKSRNKLLIIDASGTIQDTLARAVVALANTNIIEANDFVEKLLGGTQLGRPTRDNKGNKGR